MLIAARSKWLLAALAVAAVTVTAGQPAEGQRTGRCIVSDPTGTPLNIRTAPQGAVVGNVPNGRAVQVLQSSRDHKGQPWAYIGTWPEGRPIGWVFREFISCY